MPPASRGLGTRDDILAILKANRELGPEFDEHTADQLLDMMESSRPSEASPRTLEKMPKGLAPWEVFVWERNQRRLDREQRRLDRHQRRLDHGLSPVLVMVLSIPLLAVAGKVAGAFGVIAVLGFAFVILTQRH